MYFSRLYFLSLPSPVQKSRSAVRTLRHKKEEQRRLKTQRRKEQELNVSRKKAERERHKERCLAGMSKESEGESGEDDMEWFRQEVGEEPDPGGCGQANIHLLQCNTYNM